MDYKYACVIDNENFYKAFVLVINGNVMYYNLCDGDTLIDANAPITKSEDNRDCLLKPVWDHTALKWVEGASENELEEWEFKHPVKPAEPAQPTPDEDRDAMIADHEYRLTLLEMGVN